MKCLSKGWYRLISNYRKSKLRSSSKNFICQCKFSSVHIDSQVLFYNIKEQIDHKTGEKFVETLENHSLRFSMDFSFQLVGSSNGLILGFYKISNKSVPDDNDTTVVPYVGNPILNQWIPLPPFPKGKCDILMGLSFDGVPQNHFKVVICYAHCVRGNELHISRHIYSSDLGIWREKSVKFFNSFIAIKLTNFDSERSYLYRKGMTHWVDRGFMLVYHFEKDFFKIVELPSTVGRVWESEGYLHYCDKNRRGFSIWKLVDDEVFDTQFDEEGVMAKWQRCKPTIEFHSLEPQLLQIVGPDYSVGLLRVFPLNLLGFDEDLQILYFDARDMCFSYSFETGRLKKLSTCKDRKGIGWVCASFFLQPSGVNLP